MLPLPDPWRSFLGDLDAALRAEDRDGPVADLHCLGGFVIATYYGASRTTNDIDVVEAVPPAAFQALLAIGGPGTPLAKRHRVYIDTRSRVATLPENYEDRLSEMFPGAFERLRLLALDRYDLALTKLERDIDRDREDVLVLARRDFDVTVLRERYYTEVRPFVKGPVERHDATLKLWVEMVLEAGTTNGSQR